MLNSVVWFSAQITRLRKLCSAWVIFITEKKNPTTSLVKTPSIALYHFDSSLFAPVLVWPFVTSGMGICRQLNHGLWYIMNLKSTLFSQFEASASHKQLIYKCARAFSILICAVRVFQTLQMQTANMEMAWLSRHNDTRDISLLYCIPHVDVHTFN